MFKRIIFICLWAVAFFVGSAVIVASATTLLFAGSVLASAGPNDETISWIGMVRLLVPGIAGPIGLILGVLGRLPGTGRPIPGES